MTVNENATLGFLLSLYPFLPSLSRVSYQSLSLNSHILTLSLRRADLAAGDPNQIQPTSFSLFLVIQGKAEVEKPTDA